MAIGHLMRVQEEAARALLFGIFFGGREAACIEEANEGPKAGGRGVLTEDAKMPTKTE